MDEATMYSIDSERIQLEEKIRRLNAFCNSDVYKKLDFENQSLLTDQLHKMEEYHHILCRRIFLIPMPSPQISADDYLYKYDLTGGGINHG